MSPFYLFRPVGLSYFSAETGLHERRNSVGLRRANDNMSTALPQGTNPLARHNPHYEYRGARHHWQSINSTIMAEMKGNTIPVLQSGRGRVGVLMSCMVVIV